LCTGVAVDRLLKRQFSENPYQSIYLAHYMKYLPNVNDRMGYFQPLHSVWSKWFHTAGEHPLLPPSASDYMSFADSTKCNTPFPPVMDPKAQDGALAFECKPALESWM